MRNTTPVWWTTCSSGNPSKRFGIHPDTVDEPLSCGGCTRAETTARRTGPDGVTDDTGGGNAGRGSTTTGERDAIAVVAARTTSSGRRAARRMPHKANAARFLHRGDDRLLPRGGLR